MFGVIITFFTYLYNSYYYTDTLIDYKNIKDHFKFKPVLKTIYEENEYCYKTESDCENEELYNQSLIIKNALKIFIDFIEETELKYQNYSEEEQKIVIQLLECLYSLHKFPFSECFTSGKMKSFTDKEKEYNNKKQAFVNKIFKALSKINYIKLLNYNPSDEFKNKLKLLSLDLMAKFDMSIQSYNFDIIS